MKVIYIIGKYTDNTRLKIRQNINKAEYESLKLIDEGYCTIVPHNNFRGHEQFAGYDYVMRECYELIKRSDAVYIMKNHTTSKGSLREIKFAKKLKKEIMYEE